MADSRGNEGGGENFSNAVNAKILSQLTSELYYKVVEFVCFPGDLGTGYTSNKSDLRSQLSGRGGASFYAQYKSVSRR